ncbi:MAG TPA: Qat anti-phage system QueC-like protein QatC [Roseiflexaceae bacterium]|nr:Qat anti-phage system QueC-like protein QatC [Roseiflexaceae bacterium]
MKIVCSPSTLMLPANDTALQVVLYSQAAHRTQGSAGKAIKSQMLREKLYAAPRAWDFVSLALSVVTADLAGHRGRSADGWTREFDLEVAVGDATFWNSQRQRIEQFLAFLTTDLWRVHFIEGGLHVPPPAHPVIPSEDCIVLLSGGLDSLVGTIDLVAYGEKPFAISQLVRGDARNQESFAAKIGNGLRSLRLNHNARVPDPEVPPTQRARSLVFLAYGVLAATTLARYADDRQTVPLYMCENGFISINPPLTNSRLGSLSTRTTHPAFLQEVQSLLDAAELRVRIENPYQFKTKGEMLVACANQNLLKELAESSTSCGRFKRYGYRHCGRCIPCQIRRAAFLVWGVLEPPIKYVFTDLGEDDKEYAGFDDVRSAAMAIAEVQVDGIDRWLGNALSKVPQDDVQRLKDVVQRGLNEIAALHQMHGVK